MNLEQARQALVDEGRVNTSGMSEEDWLALRNLGIGASEASAAIGISEYSTPYDIAERKLGLAQYDPEAKYHRRLKMSMGHVMEPVTAGRFSEATGITVQNFNAMVRHRDHPWMFANIDRRAVGISENQAVWLETLFGQPVRGPGVIELKNVEFAKGWGKPDNVNATAGLCTSGEVPEDYLVQVQHQLAVMGYQWAFLVVTIAGWETRWYPIARDEELIDDIIAIEGDLWAMIERGELPDVDVEHPKALDILKRRYPGTNGESVDLSGLAHWRQVEMDAKEQIKELETTARVARAQLLNAMGESAFAVFGDDQVLRRKVVARKAYTREFEAGKYLDVRYGKMSKVEKDLIASGQEI